MTPSVTKPPTLAERIRHARDVDNTGDYCADLRELAAEVAALESENARLRERVADMERALQFATHMYFDGDAALVARIDAWLSTMPTSVLSESPEGRAVPLLRELRDRLSGETR